MAVSVLASLTFVTEKSWFHHHTVTLPERSVPRAFPDHGGHFMAENSAGPRAMLHVTLENTEIGAADSRAADLQQAFARLSHGHGSFQDLDLSFSGVNHSLHQFKPAEILR
jgi:hypothetical protein